MRRVRVRQVVRVSVCIASTVRVAVLQRALVVARMLIADISHTRCVHKSAVIRRGEANIAQKLVHFGIVRDGVLAVTAHFITGAFGLVLHISVRRGQQHVGHRLGALVVHCTRMAGVGRVGVRVVLRRIAVAMYIHVAAGCRTAVVATARVGASELVVPTVASTGSCTTAVRTAVHSRVGAVVRSAAVPSASSSAMTTTTAGVRRSIAVSMGLRSGGVRGQASAELGAPVAPQGFAEVHMVWCAPVRLEDGKYNISTQNANWCTLTWNVRRAGYKNIACSLKRLGTSQIASP